MIKQANKGIDHGDPERKDRRKVERKELVVNGMSVSKIILVMAVWSCGLVVGPKHIGCIMHSSCCIGDLS